MHTHTPPPTYTELDILLEQIYIIKFIQVGSQKEYNPQTLPTEKLIKALWLQ